MHALPNDIFYVLRTPLSMAYCVCYMIYDIRCTIHGISFTIHAMMCMLYDIWSMLRAACYAYLRFGAQRGSGT